MIVPSLQFGTLIGWNSMPWLNDRFKLTAIIIHDPTDDALGQYLVKNEKLWDELTGSQLLVFPLIDPPMDSRPSPFERRILSEKSHLFPLECSHMRAQLSSGASRSILYNFLTHIEFENASLPGIVLTAGNLASNEYFYIPTSIKGISCQLNALGNYCKTLSESVSTQSPELQTLVREISDSKGICINTTETLAEYLKLVYAIKEIHRGPSSFSWLALRLLETEVSSKELEDFRRINSQIQYRHTFREYANADYYCSKESCLPGCHRIDVDKLKGIEAETQMAWNTYNYFISDPRINKNINDIYISDVNISLLKGVECELNASIVQLMRMFFNIPMPEYFRKYMANISAIPKRGDHAVNLNGWSKRNQDGNLYAVSIGDVRAAYLAMNIDCFDGQSERFANLLYKFSFLRKTHSGANHHFDLDDVVTCNQLFHEQFIPFLPKLLEIKELLKTGKYSQNDIHYYNNKDIGEEVLDMFGDNMKNSSFINARSHNLPKNLANV